jgi:uncharacterized membrane protein YdjX (TVP38/TMEM64 family)
MKTAWLRGRRFWLLVLGGILIALLGSTLPLNTWLIGVKNWLVSLGPWAIPAFMLIYLLATILALPNILLILVSGTLFGLVKGVISVSLADTLGAIACFVLGRTLARKRVKRWMSKHPKFVQLDRAVGRKGWKILLLTRLSPLVPSNILNYGFSCTQVNFWQYCFFSWLGMLPMIILYVYLGSFGIFLTGGELTPAKLALQAVGLIVTIGAALYMTRFAKKALTLECLPEESNQKSEQT